MSEVSAAQPATGSQAAKSTSPSPAKAGFASALQDAESRYRPESAESEDAGTGDRKPSGGAVRGRSTGEHDGNQRLAAITSSRAHLVDGTAVWNPRDRTMLTGEDAQTDVNHRSWEFEGYLQVRGTSGREIRQVVGDDPWLWELADQSGMSNPAAAVDSVIGQLAEQWAERVGYENPHNDQVRGSSVRAQYLRNPSGLAADHQRFSNSDDTADLPPVSIDRTPGDMTPAPRLSTEPATDDDETASESSPATPGSDEGEQAAGGDTGASDSQAAPASRAAGTTPSTNRTGTIAQTGLAVDAGGAAAEAMSLSDQLWDQAERDD